MREAEVAVTFRPSGKTVYVLRGTRLLEAAAEVDIVLDQPCGGAGKCGKCRVIVSGEVGEATDAERKMLGDEEEGACAFDDLPFNTRPLYTGKPWFLPPIIRWHRLLDNLGF